MKLFFIVLLVVTFNAQGVPNNSEIQAFQQTKVLADTTKGKTINNDKVYALQYNETMGKRGFASKGADLLKQPSYLAYLYQAYKDTLSIEIGDVETIAGLLPGRKNDFKNTALMNQVLIRRLQFTDSHTAHLAFPCGTFYFADRVKYQLKAKLDYTLTLKIPDCTTLKVTANNHNDYLFLFNSNDPNYENATVCIYVNTCNPSDKTKGGVIDMSEAVNLTHMGDAAHSNITAIGCSNLKNCVIQGIQFKGDKTNTDTFIACTGKNIRVRHASFYGAADAAVYCSGHKVKGAEQSGMAIVWGNTIKNTLAGIVFKRGFNLGIVYANDFRGNGNSLACVGVNDSFSPNPYPCRQLVAFDNTSILAKGIGSWDQFALIDWCTHCTVSFNKITADNCDRAIRLYNTQNTHVSYNQYQGCKQLYSDTSIDRRYGAKNDKRSNMGNVFIANEKF